MKASALLGMLVAGQLAAALVIQALVLSIVHAGPETDAFVAAQAVPAVLLSIVAISLQSVWQPKLSVLAADANAAWRENLGVAQGQMLVCLGGSALLLIGTSKWWVPALFPGFAPHEHDLVRVLTILLLVANVFSGHAALSVSALRSRESFVLAESITLLGWLLSTAAIALSVPKFGVEAAAWVSLLRAMVTASVLHLYADAPLPNFTRGLRDVESWRQLKPLLSGSALYKTVPIVDRYWGSQAGAGMLTIYNLAQFGMGSAATIFDRALSVPSVPRLARLVESGDWAAVRKTYRGTLSRISIAAIAIAVLLIILKGAWPYLVHLILKIPAPLSSQLWIICMLLLGYLYASAAGGIVVAAFYAMGDTKTSVWVGVLGFPLAIALKSGLFVSGGISGLAIATSIYFVCNLIILCALLEKKIGRCSRQRSAERSACESRR